RSRETTTPPRLVLQVTGNAPAVAIMAPSNGTVMFAANPLALVGTATDVEDGPVAARSRWTSSLNGGLGTGSHVTATGLRPGTHTITAAAKDSDGRAGQAQLTIRVRPPNVPPTIVITSPGNGASTPAGTTVTLTATATDDWDTGDLGSRIQWTSSRDGVIPGIGASRTVVLHEGVHTLTASLVDSDGANRSAHVTSAVTPAPPVVPITAPAPDTRVLVGTPITFQGRALDATDGDLSARLEWTSDLDGSLGIGATPTVRTLRPGRHTITALAHD